MRARGAFSCSLPNPLCFSFCTSLKTIGNAQLIPPAIDSRRCCKRAPSSKKSEHKAARQVVQSSLAGLDARLELRDASYRRPTSARRRAPGQSRSFPFQTKGDPRQSAINHVANESISDSCLSLCNLEEDRRQFAERGAGRARRRRRATAWNKGRAEEGEKAHFIVADLLRTALVFCTAASTALSFNATAYLKFKIAWLALCVVVEAAKLAASRA